MQVQALEGGFTDQAVESARAFRSLLDAMSRPGSVQTLDGAEPPPPLGRAAGIVALTLCDHATPVWLAPSVSTDAVQSWLIFHTGAVLVARSDAAFAFGTWDEMLPLDDFAIGTPDYPDRSATLVIEVPELGDQHSLTGPGIQTETRLTVPCVQAFQANRALYPEGWDAVLTCGDQVAALPRTVIVET
ncbi:MAG: phosphonate C-P lyase system protein PhnH [Pseudomonadota bacterium]